MVYVVPSAQIIQEFQSTVVGETPVLNALIYGPQMDFLDLDDADDRATAYVGAYDSFTDTTYEIPGLDPAAVLKTTSVQVVFDEAYLEYFYKAVGVGAYEYERVAGKLNEVTISVAAAAPNLRDYTNVAGTTFSRDAIFESRDVQVGDGVEISAVVGLTLVTVLTKVSGFIHETIAATIAAAVADVANEATVVASEGPVTPGVGNTGDDTVAVSGPWVGSLEDDVITDTYVLEVIVGGADPVIGAATADPGNTGDDAPVSGGFFDSAVDDTYTVTVTLGGASGVAEITVTSVEGDGAGPLIVSAATVIPIGTKGVTLTFPTFGGDTVLTLGDIWEIAVTASAARFSVTSSSGTDDVAVIPFPGFTGFFAVGTRGLMAAVTDGGDTVLMAGDTFSIPVVMAVDAVTATSGGTYTGPTDLTYTVEVVEGGVYGVAKILATSTDTDSSGPLTVSAPATAVAVGTYGATIEFAANTQGGLIKGDKWTVVVASEKKGAVKSFKTRDNLPSSILDLGVVPLNVRLFIIQNDRTVSRYREDIPADEAWEIVTSPTTGKPAVEIKSSIYLTDPTYTDLLTGLTIPLGVYAARQLIGWDAFRLENTQSKNTVAADVLEIEAALGRINPRNPLAYAVSKAALNSVTVPISYVATASDEVTDFDAVLDILKECDDVYTLVPLTKEVLHHQALDAHLAQMSTPEEGRWRIGIICRDLTVYKAIYETRVDTDGDVVPYTARVLDDPDTAATDYRLLVASDGQGVDFIRDNVVPGNVVRVGYYLDLDGEVTYTEKVVEEVVSSTVLKFTDGLAAEVSVASKFELHILLSKTQQAEEHALIAESIADRRVFLIYPDLVGAGSDGFVHGYHVAAAIAGMRAGLPPHQGFTNLQVQGFTDFSRAFQYFSRDQLNTMAGSGIFIVTQTTFGATPFVRHQLATDMSAILFREMSVTSNVDYISYYLSSTMKPFIGIYNNTPDTRAEIERALDNAISVLVSDPLPRLGSQLVSGTVVSVTASATFCDTAEAVVDIVVPCPLNNLTVRLRISA